MCLKFASYFLYDREHRCGFLLVYTTKIIKIGEKFYVGITELNLSFVIFRLLEGTRTGMNDKKCEQD
jgi:hypothetical protein